MKEAMGSWGRLCERSRASLGQPGLLLLPLLAFMHQTAQDSMEAEILLF